MQSNIFNSKTHKYHSIIKYHCLCMNCWICKLLRELHKERRVSLKIKILSLRSLQVPMIIFIKLGHLEILISRGGIWLQLLTILAIRNKRIVLFLSLMLYHRTDIIMEAFGTPSKDTAEGYSHRKNVTLYKL